MEKAKDPKLLINYHADTDTLALWNRPPANEGQIVAEHLTSESNAEGDVTGVALERAAELLRSYLFQDGR
jgi:uncharacterized protein YuzE